MDELRLVLACIKMEYRKIMNLWDTAANIMPKFNTKKWIEVHDESGGTYNTNKQIMCDYSDAWLVVKEIINVIRPNENSYYKKLASKIIYHLLAACQRLRTH